MGNQRGTGVRKFDIIDHTADVGVAAHGATREELFGNAALGMFTVIGDLGRVAPREKRDVIVDAKDLESLLVSFLAELLFIHEIHHFMICDVRVDFVTDTRVQATVRGEALSPKHEIYTEIKAVTHHDLKVEHTGDGWNATVLFDI